MPHTPMPALFLGHGNPLITLTTNTYTHSWHAIADALPRPRAIVVISAHWVTRGVFLTTGSTLHTIHDFTGFPPELYAIQYEPPGDATLAADLCALLGKYHAQGDNKRGLDHGAWTVLRHMFPLADIPIVQISLDINQTAADHFAIGQLLRDLRYDKILILGTGNLVHNLSLYDWTQSAAASVWASNFEHNARALMEKKDYEALFAYQTLPYAKQAIPTPEHFWPLLYVLAQRMPNDPITFPVEGFEGGSLSMLSIQVGSTQ